MLIAFSVPVKPFNGLNSLSAILHRTYPYNWLPVPPPWSPTFQNLGIHLQRSLLLLPWQIFLPYIQDPFRVFWLYNCRSLEKEVLLFLMHTIAIHASRGTYSSRRKLHRPSPHFQVRRKSMILFHGSYLPSPLSASIQKQTGSYLEAFYLFPLCVWNGRNGCFLSRPFSYESCDSVCKCKISIVFTAASLQRWILVPFLHIKFCLFTALKLSMSAGTTLFL